MSNIFVRIIGEFKDKEFKRAQKSTLGLTKQFNGLRRSATRAFAAVAGVSALKRSVQAFAAEDAASQKLTKSLDNLGLRFESSGVETFLEGLEKATAVSKEQLYPAFQQLASTTLSVAESQALLGTALDISAGTGKDLGSVVTALSRAYNGNFASLGKLQTSYTTAELEAMGFQEAMRALNTEFSGSAQAAANTYEGKIKKLNIAFGDAAEAIGEGVIDALEAIGSGNYDKGLERIVGFGEAIADAFRGASKFLAYNKLLLSSFGMSRKEFEAAKLAIDSAFAGTDPAKQRTFMRERAKFLKAEQTQTEKIRKDREKSAKLLEKEKNNQKIIAEAAKKFDMERIQIEAALQGKINDVEEYRLKLQRAILNENADMVIKYTGLLKEAEAQAAELADLLARLPEFAENPFHDWPATIARIQYLLKELDFQIPIEVLFAEKGLKLDQDKMTVTKLERMDVQANNVYINGNVMNGNVIGGGMTDPNIRKTPWGDYDIRDPNASLKVATLAFDDAKLAELEALLAEQEALKAIADSDAALTELDAILSEMESGKYNAAPTINITVEGNVTSEYDLAQTIIDQQYQYQRSGGKLTYNTVAI